MGEKLNYSVNYSRYSMLFFSIEYLLCSRSGWFRLKCSGGRSAIGLGFYGTETNCTVESHTFYE